MLGWTGERMVHVFPREDESPVFLGLGYGGLA